MIIRSLIVDPPPVLVLPKALKLLWMVRPHFMAGSAVVYMVGALVARSETHVLDLWACGLGLALVWLVQLATHLFNEHADLSADALNVHRTLFSGGSGVLQTNIFPPRLARWAGAAALLLATSILLVLSTRPAFGPPTILIFALAAFGAAEYSLPPLKLAYRGWGTLDTTMVAGLLTPVMAYNLQTGRISGTLLLAALPLVVLVLGNTITVALPDYEADRAAGKRTLVVRFGPRRAAALYTIVLVAGCALAVAVVPKSLLSILTLAFALLVAALSLIVVWSGGYYLPQRFGLNGLLGIGAFLAVTVAEAVGFWAGG